MENRFSFKDFLVLLILVVLVGLVLLGMKQYDRQWEQIQAVKSRLDEQSQDLREIRQKLAQGIVATTTGSASDAQANDPFVRLREVEKSPDFARGDWLIGAFAGKVATLTPFLSGDTYASDVQDRVLQSLADRDPDTLEWRPILAKGWTIDQSGLPAYQKFVDEQRKLGKKDDEINKDSNCPISLKITFTMREGPVFSDGRPVTADDVVFTYKLIMDPAMDTPRQKAYYEKIVSCEKAGDDQVVFTYREPYFESFNLAAEMSILPKHFYSKFKADEINKATGMLLGSGPYRLNEPNSWSPDKPLELIRNERYWGVAPPMDKIKYRVITNDVARLTAFRNGEIDSYGAPAEAYVKLIKDQELLKRANSYEYFAVSGGYRYIAWNEKDQKGQPTPFADKRVRRAMTMLIDRDRLMKELTLGYAKLATGPFSPLSKQYDTNVQPLAHDVEAARKLLAEAGLKTGPDGALLKADGSPFTIKLTYPSGSANYEKMALFIKDSFAKAGIALSPDPLEWAVFTERLKTKNFDAISLGWSSGIETDIFQMFHSSQAVEGGDNFMSYKSDELDATIAKARATIDEAPRLELWKQAHRILNEDQPYTFLWFGKSLVFVDNRIKNVRLIRRGLTPDSEWYVPKAAQRWK